MVATGRDRERTMNLVKMRHLIAAAVLGAAAMLAACTVTVEE